MRVGVDHGKGASSRVEEDDVGGEAHTIPADQLNGHVPAVAARANIVAVDCDAAPKRAPEASARIVAPRESLKGLGPNWEDAIVAGPTGNTGAGAWTLGLTDRRRVRSTAACRRKRYNR
jgi:hypothetical protein